MKVKGIFSGANKHINENLGYYLLSILFIATGVIVGLYCVKYMESSDKTSLINYITSMSTSPKGEIVGTTKIFINALKNNLPMVIGLWILGLTFVGAPIILFIDLYKGFSLGFTFSFFIYAFKARGIAVAFLGVLPQNIIYIPCLIFLSVIALKYSIIGIKEKFSKKYIAGSYTSVRNYTMIFAITTIAMGIGFLIETFLTPMLLNLILKGTGV